MKQETKRYSVTIFGELYTLIGDESEHDVTKAAQYVDDLMREISSKSPHSKSYDKAILTALKVALARTALESEQQQSTKTIKNIIDRIDCVLTS